MSVCTQRTMDFLRLLVISALVTGCAFAQSCSMEDPIDVLILGAGVAGVAAARTLYVNGQTNFEANNYIGGRIRRDSAWNVELGANWIHGLDLEHRDLHPLWREWRDCAGDTPAGVGSPMDRL